MRKLIATLAILIVCNHVNSQNWDRHMLVKKMDIRIKADAFTATTFIEMEFYNPTATEMEGLYTFQLEPGQAITAFQLDLFGKFRDGSIEEKWKATNAYNTIVGKKVDPALLRMDSYNQYSLRIYPVPAMSSRRITMTIQQLLKVNDQKAIYILPLKINDTIEQLNVQINAVRCSSAPSVIKGLLSYQVFNNNGNSYSLTWNASALKAADPLSFSIPMAFPEPVLCTKTIEGQRFFALRLQKEEEKEYVIIPRKVTVYWDVSVSGRKRSAWKEIAFLKEYVFQNNITQLTIIPFNQSIKDTAVFYTAGNYNSRWVEYLKALNYEGATQLGLLDFSSANADAILLFSDGNNSFGKHIPIAGKVHVYAIAASAAANKANLENIIGMSGGRYIDLTVLATADAVTLAGKAENILLDISADTGKVIIDQQLVKVRGKELFLSGKLPVGAKELTVVFGNNNSIHTQYTVPISGNSECSESVIERMNMLNIVDSVAHNFQWQQTLEFGKKEKVVTPSTAFIVLEKIEDYIKFNITPPKELEGECDMNLFVKADAERRKQFKNRSEFEVLKEAANAYNERLTWWDKQQPLITITEGAENEVTSVETKRVADDKRTATTNVTIRGTASVPMEGNDNVIAGTEVVVTALGQTRQPKEMGYSVSRVRSAELTQANPVNVQNGLTGKVSGLQVQTVNNGVFADTRILLRGIRSLTGNNQPLLVLDGVPLELRLLNSINPNDILDVTVLKSAAATAIYGPDGVNGALVMTTKKGSRYYGGYYYQRGAYKLKNCEDVEYLQELKLVSKREKLTTYYDLKKIYGSDPGFYFDMAQHLYESGYLNEAIDILFSATDVCKGDTRAIKAAGYTLESWKQFDKAIEVYKGLLTKDTNDPFAYRDLGLAYFQNGNYQEAVDIYYAGIKKSTEDVFRVEQVRIVKSMMLQEMNAIIAVHSSMLDLSNIRPAFIKSLPVDLRITVDCNNGYYYSKLNITEPDGTVCNTAKPITRSGGRYGSSQKNYYNYVTEEYQVQHAVTGKYKVKVNYYDNYSHIDGIKIPNLLRIMTFRNMGRADQSIAVENVIMDNQYGMVEIGEVKW